MPLYEEIEIEDMTYDPETLSYTYPCPCGDKFKIYLEDLWDGEDIADCQSCTLFISVIYEEENLPPLPKDDDDKDKGEKGDNPVEASSEDTKKQDEQKVAEGTSDTGADSSAGLAKKVEGLSI